MRKLTTLQAQIAVIKQAANTNVAAKVISMCNTNNAASIVLAQPQCNTAKYKNKNVVRVTKMRITNVAKHNSVNPVTTQQYVRVTTRNINTIYFCNNKVISAATAKQYALKNNKCCNTAQNSICTINTNNVVSIAKCKQA